MPTPRRGPCRALPPAALLALALAGGALAPPAAVQAQEGAQADAQEERAQPRPESTLIFERELFGYPSFERRNPFATLLANPAGGPRFEQMRLEGIIYSDNPSLSIALLSAGRIGAPSPDAPGRAVGQSTRVRVGERWGNVRVLEIRRNQVIVEVEEFGLRERRTMDLPTRGQGGSR